MAQFKDFLTNPAYIGGYNAIFSGNTADREKGSDASIIKKT